MATELKPRTAAGYDQNVTLACERTLLTLLSAFGNLKETLTKTELPPCKLGFLADPSTQ